MSKGIIYLFHKAYMAKIGNRLALLRVLLHSFGKENYHNVIIRKLNEGFQAEVVHVIM